MTSYRDVVLALLKKEFRRFHDRHKDEPVDLLATQRAYNEYLKAYYRWKHLDHYGEPPPTVEFTEDDDG